MKKLKYGLLLILSMILFSVPVLAAKTYYLPSKVTYGSGDYDTYSYDKYGHLTKLYDIEEEEDETITWKYKYDKNGKRISGEEYHDGKLVCKLTFDKNDHLKTRKSVTGYGGTVKFKWNSKGYFEGDNGIDNAKCKYYYYKNGKIKKVAIYYNGELNEVAYFDKSGLRSKNPPSKGDYKYTYEYVLDKNGLVKTKIITIKDPGGTWKTTLNYYYSKTKTDAKTYYMFIDGWNRCTNNGNL